MTIDNQPTQPENPHVVWRQALGYALFGGFLSYFAGSAVQSVLLFLTGAAIFVDAWKSGIYVKRESKSFLNISPKAWGIAATGLLIVTYPLYVYFRNRLRTRQEGNVYFIASVLLSGGLLLYFFWSRAFPPH